MLPPAAITSIVVAFLSIPSTAVGATGQASAPGAAAAAEPPPPAVSATVLPAFEAVRKALEAGDAAKALVAADALLEAAKKSNDPVGVAHGHQARALCLLSLNRAKEGLEAWQEAGDAWQQAGYGPGKLEAAGWVGLLVYGALPDEQAKIRQGLIKLAREEAKWPLTAAQVLNDIGGRFIEADERPAAEEILRAALELKQKHAPDSETLLTTLDLLGALARERSDLTAAENYLGRGLTLREKYRPGSVEVAVALTALTDVAESRGDLARAESLGRRAVAVAEKAAPDSPELADALTNLGGTLRLRGELKEAEAAHRRALALREKQQGPGSAAVAESLNNLGLVAEDRGDLTGAEEAHRKALGIFEKASPESAAVARSLANLGLVLRAKGDLAAADEASSRALALYQKHAPGSVYEAQIWNNLGTVSDARGALAEAEERFRRSLAIYEKAAPGSVDVVATLINLGGLAETRGQYEEAETLLRRGLALYEKVGPNSPRVALIWNNLGNVAFARGDLGEAEIRFRRALDIWEKSAPGSVDLAQGWVNLGNVARERGDLSVAEELYRRALAVTEKVAPDSTRAAVPLANLALVLQERGDLDGAGELVTRAVALYEKHASESMGLMAALNTLGNLAGLRTDYSTAEAAYRRALALCEKQAPGSRLVVILLHNLARVTLDRGSGDLKAAEDLLKRGLSLSEQAAPDALDGVLLRNTLGTVAVKRGDLAAAEKLFETAWERVRHEGLGLSGDESRQAFAGSFSYVAANLVLCRASLGHTESALATLEQSRAQSLTQTLMDRRLLEAAGSSGGAAWDAHQSAVRRRDSALIALDRAMLEVQKARQAKLPDLISGAEARFTAAQAEYVRARADAEARWSEVQKALTARDASLGGGSSPAPGSPPSAAFSLSALRAKLPEGSLYAAFSVGEGASLLFLVPADAAQPIRVVQIEVPSEKLRAQVAALRRAASDPKVPATEAVGAGQALFAALFPGEVARAAVRAAKRLIVSPDDFLWEVPFAALVTSDESSGGQPAYLGLATPLTYAPSLTVFAQGRGERRGGPAPSGQASAALVVGDPAFGASVSGGAESRSYLYVDGKAPDPLPASRTEAREVAALYGATPLLGAQASEGGVRAALPAARIVHLATHGVLRLTVPMASGLLLAPGSAATGPSDDGALQAWEVFAMRLNAGVAVLSACNTGRGRAQRGEGVVGLIRAWQVAGARSVVASLWPVADDSTARLMVALHRELKAGRPGDEALRAAMAAVQGEAKTGHPFWWAPFFVTGDPDATVPAGR